jgi:ABC-2 type transport system permease protein
VNRALFARTLAAQRTKLLVVVVGLLAWSAILPIVYATFGADLKEIVNSGLIPKQFTQFGGGDIFSLAGSIAIGAIHPISILLNSIFAIGFAVAAVAGERQRGTLEVLLARPLSRRTTYVTLLVATLVFVGVTMAATVAGSLIGSLVGGVSSELDTSTLPLFWLNGVLLYGCLGTIALASSVSFDRLTPALGVVLVIVVVSYFLEVLGSLWPDAEVLQPYSLFHYFPARAILTGTAGVTDVALLAAVSAVAIGWALVVFPRRDLAAPA